MGVPFQLPSPPPHHGAAASRAPPAGTPASRLRSHIPRGTPGRASTGRCHAMGRQRCSDSRLALGQGLACEQGRLRAPPPGLRRDWKKPNAIPRLSRRPRQGGGGGGGARPSENPSEPQPPRSGGPEVARAANSGVDGGQSQGRGLGVPVLLMGDGTAVGEWGGRESGEYPQGGGLGSPPHPRGPVASTWVCSFISASLSRVGLSPSLPWQAGLGGSHPR